VKSRLGYHIVPNDAGVSAFAFGDFLKNGVGRRYSWLSVTLDNSDLTTLKLKVLKEAFDITVSKFLELKITNAKITAVDELLNHLCWLRPDRLILTPEPGFNEIALKNIIDRYLTNDIWVETIGVPYCKTYTEHVWENYNECDPQYEKDGRCTGCVFVDSCIRIDTTRYLTLTPVKNSNMVTDFNEFMV